MVPKIKMNNNNHQHVYCLRLPIECENKINQLTFFRVYDSNEFKSCFINSIIILGRHGRATEWKKNPFIWETVIREKKAKMNEKFK